MFNRLLSFFGVRMSKKNSDLRPCKTVTTTEYSATLEEWLSDPTLNVSRGYGKFKTFEDANLVPDALDIPSSLKKETIRQAQENINPNIYPEYNLY